MSTSGHFCVQCGKTTPADLLRQGMCAECFLEKKKFSEAPLVVDFEICSHCGWRKKGELWVDDAEGVTEGNVRMAVASAVTFSKELATPRVNVDLRQEDQHGKVFACSIVVTGTAEDLPVREEHKTRARIKGATCLRCSRYHGNYYEGILQLRALNRALTKQEMKTAREIGSRLIDRIVREGDKFAFVLKDEEIHGGLDIYVGTINTGRAMSKAFADAFGATIKETAKMAGAKDGNTLYRITFLVRVPEYAAGDIILWRDLAYSVKGVNPKKTTLVNLKNGHQVVVERDDLEHAKVLRAADAQEAVVVSQEGRDLQILDPVTYKTVTVIAPDDFVPGTATVRVLKWEEDYFVLGPAEE